MLSMSSACIKYNMSRDREAELFLLKSENPASSDIAE